MGFIHITSLLMLYSHLENNFYHLVVEVGVLEIFRDLLVACVTESVAYMILRGETRCVW